MFEVARGIALIKATDYGRQALIGQREPIAECDDKGPA
jgi:hypothetical protein